MLVLPVACMSRSTPVEPKLSDFFPADGVVKGWTKSGDPELYGRETLYDLVDGQADAFFAYGFEQVAVQSYQSDGGDVVRVHIWQLKTPADAYGLFTYNLSGQPEQAGNDGDADPGRRIAFWQDRYFVQVFAFRPVDHAVLTTWAGHVSDVLPKGGERPALIDRLPPGNANALFFREEISLMSYLWLGGENLLGLSQETQGVLGRYLIDGKVAYVLLIEYPTANAAAAGLQALRGGQIDQVVVADLNGRLLGAVLGELTAERAQTMLNDAIKERP